MIKKLKPIHLLFKKTARFTQLKKFVFEGNDIEEEFAMKLIEALIPNLHLLEEFRFNRNGEKDEVLKTLYRLVNGKERSAEGCLIETLLLGSINYSSEMVSLSLKFIEDSDCVKHLDVTNPNCLKVASNRFYEFSEQNSKKTFQ